MTQLLPFPMENGDTVWINPAHVVAVTGPGPLDLERGRIRTHVLVLSREMILDVSPTEFVRALNHRTAVNY